MDLDLSLAAAPLGQVSSWFLQLLLLLQLAVAAMASRASLLVPAVVAAISRPG